MRHFMPALALSLLLAACATTQPMDSITDAPIPYACAGNRSFTVSFPAHGARATIRAGNEEKTLPLARSASGARYADGDREFWGKGDSATLTGFAGGPYTACKTD